VDGTRRPRVFVRPKRRDRYTCRRTVCLVTKHPRPSGPNYNNSQNGVSIVSTLPSVPGHSAGGSSFRYACRPRPFYGRTGKENTKRSIAPIAIVPCARRCSRTVGHSRLVVVSTNLIKHRGRDSRVKVRGFYRVEGINRGVGGGGTIFNEIES